MHGLERRYFARLAFLALALAPIAAQAQRPDFDSRVRTRLERLATSGDSKSDLARNAERASLAQAYLDEHDSEPLNRARLSLTRWGRPKMLSNIEAPLSEPSDASAQEIARAFINEHKALFQLTSTEVESLAPRSVVPVGEASVCHFVQRVGGVDVFGGTVMITVSAKGEVLRAGVAEIVPGATLPEGAFTISAERALRQALTAAGESEPGEITRIEPAQADAETFRASLGPIEVRRVAFPSDPETVVAAYEAHILVAEAGYHIVISASDGALLLRRDLTRRMASGRVYRQDPGQGPPELIDFPNEWMRADPTTTNGAFVDAYRDADGDGSADTERIENLKDGRAFARDSVFDFPLPGEGDDPREFPAAALTNAFALGNQAHDYFYALGFDELSGNLQFDNQGRGGRDGDPAVIRVHDTDFSRGARALPLPEGTSGIITLSFVTGESILDPTDDHDDAYSGMTIFHEYAHLVTERLVNGPNRTSCLVGTHSGALNEGWADYFASSFFDEPVFGAYAAQDPEKGFRRSSLADSTLTYSDLGNEGFEVHNDGEIWSATLWDLREALGQETTDQLVVKGLKMTPCDPTMIDARDAIYEADRARNQGENIRQLQELFAARGMGVSATGFDGFRATPTMFTSAFDTPPRARANRLPVINTRILDFVFLDDSLGYQIIGIDPDNDPLTFELLQAPEGMTLSPTGRLAWTADTFTEQLARVAVSDGTGQVIHAVTVPVVTILDINRAISIDGPRFSRGFAAFFIRPGTTITQLTTRGGAGDADVTLFGPAVGDDLASERFGSDETLTIVDPTPGFWIAFVDAFPEYADVRLRFLQPTAQAFSPNVIFPNISRPTSTESYFSVNIPPGADALTVAIGGGTGDVDLYLAFDRFAVCQRSNVVDMPCDIDLASEGPGNFHSITVTDDLPAQSKVARVESPAAGRWFINLSTHRAISDVTLNITLDTGAGVPTISDGGVVNAASFASQLSPGAIATLFGGTLVPINEEATTLPLPREMQGLKILFDGVEAPLFFGSAGQVNFQVPSEAEVGEALVFVEARGLRGTLAPGVVQLDAPGVFTYTSASGALEPVVIHADGSLVTPESPARPGEVLVIFFTGLSSVSNRPASGEAAQVSPLSTATIDPVVSIGGERAQVLFAGLTAGLVGLAQLNIQLPTELPAGDRAALEIRLGSSRSVPVELAITNQ